MPGPKLKLQWGKKQQPSFFSIKKGTLLASLKSQSPGQAGYFLLTPLGITTTRILHHQISQ
jgi:hypothetical protein